MNAVVPGPPRRGRFVNAGHTMGRVGRFAWPWLVGLAAVVGVLVLPSLAGASVAQEEQAGSRLLGELESGELRCAEASGSDFDRIGEYAMGRMFGSMMGGYGYGSGSSASANDEDFDGPSAAAMVGMMAVLIGAVALALFLLARRHPGGPLDTLERRFAKGELTAEEYQERKRLLEGSRSR